MYSQLSVYTESIWKSKGGFEQPSSNPSLPTGLHAVAMHYAVTLTKDICLTARIENV